MKRFIPIFVAAGIMMLLPACKEKKQTQDIITTRYVPKRIQAPIKMPADVRQDTVAWLGRNYQVNIERVAIDSVTVKDDTGQQFVDNRITLSIVREDNSVFFKHQFTKTSFASYLDDAFKKNALLSNMIFHKTEGNELHFAVTVSMPDSDDEFIPLNLTVTNLGNISIERDSNLDTWGGDINDEQFQ